MKSLNENVFLSFEEIKCKKCFVKENKQKSVAKNWFKDIIEMDNVSYRLTSDFNLFTQI